MIVVKASIILLGLVALNFKALAGDGMLATAGLFYYEQGASTPPDTDDSTRLSRESSSAHTEINLGLAYHFEALVLGLRYYDFSITTDTMSRSTQGHSKWKQKVAYRASGIAVGYYNGWIANAVWLFEPRKISELTNRDSSNAETQTVEYPGQGYVVEVGHSFSAGSFAVGPLLTKFVFNYDSEVVHGVTRRYQKSLKESFLIPQVALWLEF